MAHFWQGFGSGLRSGEWLTASRMHAYCQETLLAAAAFPAVLINVGHGQNGFLTAAPLGARCTGSIAGHARRPADRPRLAAAWLVPLLSRSIAGATFTPLGLCVGLALYGCVLRRAALDRVSHAVGAHGVAQA